MSINMSNGITVVETNDNVLYPFSTDLLVTHPINAIVANTVGFTTINGMNVVKVDINAASIQLYMYLVTGFTLQPLGNYLVSNPEVVHVDVNSFLNESMIESDETDITSICFEGDGLDILDDDFEFEEFDTFVQDNHQPIST